MQLCKKKIQRMRDSADKGRYDYVGVDCSSLGAETTLRVRDAFTACGFRVISHTVRAQDGGLPFTFIGFRTKLLNAILKQRGCKPDKHTVVCFTLTNNPRRTYLGVSLKSLYARYENFE